MRSRFVTQKTTTLLLVTALLSGCAAQKSNEVDQAPTVQAGAGEVDAISTNPLGIKDAVRLGVLSSSSVSSADLAIRQRKNDVVLARAAYYPELYVNLAPVKDPDELASGGIGFRYTLYDFGERAALVSASLAGLERSQYEVYSEIDNAVAKTVEKYIDLAVDRDQIVAAKKYRASLRELEGRVRARVEIGVASSVDLNDIETTKLEATTSVFEAEADESNSREALFSLVGVMPKSVMSVAGLRKTLLPDTSITKPTGVETYPKVLALLQKLREDTYKLEAVQAGIFPRIGLKLGLDLGLGKSGSVGQTGLVAGPEISDVFSLGGGGRERRQNAELDVAITQKSLDEELRLIRLEFAQARNSFNASQQRVNQRRDILKLTIKTRDIMVGEYEIGSRSLRDLLDAEERIYQARVDLNQSYRRNLSDRLRMLMATNLTSKRLYGQPK